MIHSPGFFPKQFHRKFFPGLHKKFFPAHAMNAWFVFFQKCRIASFARFLHPVPTSYSQPRKTGKKRTPSIKSSFGTASDPFRRRFPSFSRGKLHFFTPPADPLISLRIATPGRVKFPERAVKFWYFRASYRAAKLHGFFRVKTGILPK